MMCDAMKSHDLYVLRVIINRVLVTGDSANDNKLNFCKIWISRYLNSIDDALHTHTIYTRLSDKVANNNNFIYFVKNIIIAFIRTNDRQVEK